MLTSLEEIRRIELRAEIAARLLATVCALRYETGGGYFDAPGEKEIDSAVETAELIIRKSQKFEKEKGES